MRPRQAGFTFVVTIILIVIGSVMFIAGTVVSNRLNAEQDEKTTQAMANVKEALIGYAVSVKKVGASGNERPGELPCPDTDNDGDENFSCKIGAIGRVPWKSLGIPEPKDAFGETLWYALDGAFRKEAANHSIINSDTRASMQVFGGDGTTLLTPSGSEAVAIIFSPGAPLNNQSRSTQTSALCAASGEVDIEALCANNYLDKTGSALLRDNAVRNGPFIAGAKTGNFNDRLLILTANELMRAVEKVVAAQARLMLSRYFDTYHFYPYPAHPNDIGCTQGAAFPDPLARNCKSDASVCRGRLPNLASPHDWVDLASLPTWFFNNRWNQVLYYSAGAQYLAAAPTNCAMSLQVGSLISVRALFITAGSPLNTTLRPSIDLSKYLEDTANQDGWAGVTPNADMYVTPSRTSNDRIYPFTVQ